MSTPNRWPVGSLARALADAASAKADGTAVSARDLGCVPSRTPNETGDGTRLPFIVVTADLQAALRLRARVRAAVAQAAADDGGSDADDWDTDDGPANDPAYWMGDETDAAEAAFHAAAKAKDKGVTVPGPATPYSVHNPFTSRQVWFASGDDAQGYARAASLCDVEDGDLGVWSASGPADGEYWPYRGGRPYAGA